MTTNKPEVLAWTDPEEANFLAGWFKDQLIAMGGDDGIIAKTCNTALIRLSDYEALRADRDQQYDMKIKARKQRDEATAKLSALQAEREKLREHLQNLIDQATPLEPAPGNPMWSRRIQLDDVIAERDQLRAECEKLRKDAEFGRSVLSKREPGKVYGCHCDLEEGMEPDGCVIDSGERHNCIYAKDISVKEQCNHWRVIAIDAAMQEGNLCTPQT